MRSENDENMLTDVVTVVYLSVEVKMVVARCRTDNHCSVVTWMDVGWSGK